MEEDFPMLNELMQLADSPRLHDRMSLWFGQEAVEAGFFKNLIRAAIDHLKRMIPKRRELIQENEALGPRGVALDSLESLRKTQAIEIDLLASLIKVYGQADANIRMQEGFVQKMAENN